MTDTKTEATVNRTRWGRSSFLLLGGLATAGAVAFAATATAGASMFVSTSAQTELEAYGLRTPQNTALVRGITTHDFDGNPRTDYVATFSLPKATANSLCVTHKMEMLGNPITLLLTVGDNDPSTNEIDINGVNLDVLSADTKLTLFGSTSVNQAPSSLPDMSKQGAPTVDPMSDDEVGIFASGGAGLDKASAVLLNAEITQAQIPTLDARLIVGDVSCPSARQ